MLVPMHQLTRYHLDVPWDTHAGILKLGAPTLVEVCIDIRFDTTPWPESFQIIDFPGSFENIFSYNAGIDAFDMANVYSNRLAEDILGHTIKQHKLPRDKIVIMTKLFCPLSRDPTEFLYESCEILEGKGYVNQHRLSCKHIFDSVQHSLHRLRLNYIDVLQCTFCHRFDPDTPIKETMQALHDVLKAGYVRYVSMSSCYAWRFHAMQNYAINNKSTPFISMQNRYNMLCREEEHKMFPTLKHFGVRAIPWSPLARGALTRPLERQQQTKHGTSDRMPPGLYTQSDANQTIVNQQATQTDLIEEIVKKRGSVAPVSVAWTLGKEGVSAPIVGTTSLSNLADILAAIHIKLTEEEIKYLEEPYQPVGH
ncbi:aryl-alcohol dehydrogenase [Mycena maculata]|uniref:Aryl-alcohol dehydrogenase n=1 Tax=Mycena maculata TaxID=230809 RepID=A0AAD7K7N4_9AGAR|nr:aryl-alcohol dehydrogenase [Mycena maculata]